MRVLRSPGGSRGGEEGRPWEGNVSPILHFTGSLEGSELGQRTKSCCTWGDEPQRAGESLSSPFRGRPNPAFPSSLHTHSPSPSYNREPKSPEEKGERTGQLRTQNSPPPSAESYDLYPPTNKHSHLHIIYSIISGGSLSAHKPRLRNSAYVLPI